MTGSKYVALPAALAAGADREGLRAAMLSGDVRARRVLHGGTRAEHPPEHCSGAIDWERSTIAVNGWIDNSLVQGPVEVEVNLEDVREHFGLDQQPTRPHPEETRGTRRTYDWEAAGLELLGQIHRGEIKPEPEDIGDVVELYRGWFEAKNQAPTKSMLYEHAQKLWLEIS